MLETEWTNKNIDLDIDLESIDYYGNRELLAQVWLNILGNAIKFVETNGTIRVLLYKLKNSVTVSVEDNGMGMSPEVMQRIYEKFYQGDRSHSTSGNGLGLALVKRIVDLHQGNIQVSSEEREGTVFLVELSV